MGQETIAGRSLSGRLRGSLLGWWNAARLAVRRPDAPVPAAAAASIPSPASVPGAAVPPASPLPILAAALRVPHAASPAELAAAIARDRVRPQLDTELADDRGFPIMTARCPEADDEAVHDMIAIWLTGEGLPDRFFGDEQWRALALAGAVTDELAAGAASACLATAGTAPMLELALLLPPGWTGSQRTVAANWLRHRVAQSGWPAECIAPVRGSPDAGPAAAFARLSRETAAAGQDTAPCMTLLVACDSAIGEDAVERWAMDGALFSASHAQGILPGEGAAGLLLGDLRHAAPGDVPPALSACEEGWRTTSADDSRRADPVLLLGLADRTLRHGGTAAPDVAMLVADTGHRTNRVLELTAYAANMLPHLDGTDDVVRTGLACGNCGMVPFVAALALAWHYARERAAPVMCVSNGDAFSRCVALVRPSIPSTATSQSMRHD
jgi:hypothetical protein